jgi:hypothetical protein
LSICSVLELSLSRQPVATLQTDERTGGALETCKAVKRGAGMASRLTHAAIGTAGQPATASVAVSATS